MASSWNFFPFDNWSNKKLKSWHQVEWTKTKSSTFSTFNRTAIWKLVSGWMLLKIFQRCIDHSLSDNIQGTIFLLACLSVTIDGAGSVPVWGPMFDRWAQWWWRMCRGQNSVLCLHHPSDGEHRILSVPMNTLSRK